MHKIAEGIKKEGEEKYPKSETDASACMIHINNLKNKYNCDNVGTEGNLQIHV